MIKSRLTKEGFIAVRSEYTQLSMTPTELLVYSIVASYTGDNKACFETNKTIAERIGASVSTVQRAFKSLENKGYIIKEEQEDYYLAKRFEFKSNYNPYMELEDTIFKMEDIFMILLYNNQEEKNK